MFPHNSKTKLHSISKIFDKVPVWRVFQYNGRDRRKLYIDVNEFPQLASVQRGLVYCLVYLQENAAKFRFLATNRRQL